MMLWTDIRAQSFLQYSGDWGSN